MFHLPDDSPLIWLVPLCIGFVVCLLLTPLVRLAAIHFQILDRPVGQKIHKIATPLMGGVAVYAAFACATFTVLPTSPSVIGLLSGGLVAVLVGVADEIFSLSPLTHLLGQVGAALTAILTGIGVVHSLSSPFTALTAPGVRIPAVLGLTFTLFWLVGMMNTMNFLDGLDGLTTGVGALAALLLAAWASESKRFFLIPATAHREDLILPLILAGALLGFLPYNWHVARIFLGDSGSMFLGFAVGALAITGPTKLGTALLVLLIPVLDVAWAIIRRQLSGRSFLSGDKQHVYHRMLEFGLSHTATVLLLYALCTALGALDLLLHKIQKLIAFLVLATVVGATFVILEWQASQRVRSSDAEEPHVAGVGSP